MGSRPLGVQPQLPGPQPGPQNTDSISGCGGQHPSSPSWAGDETASWGLLQATPAHHQSHARLPAVGHIPPGREDKSADGARAARDARCPVRVLAPHAG